MIGARNVNILKSCKLILITLLLSGCVTNQLQIKKYAEYSNAFSPSGTISVIPALDDIKHNNQRSIIWSNLKKLGFSETDIFPIGMQSDYTVLYTLKKIQGSYQNPNFHKKPQAGSSAEGIGQGLGKLMFGSPKPIINFNGYIFILSITDTKTNKEVYNAQLSYTDERNTAEALIEKCMITALFDNFLDLNGSTQQITMIIDESNKCVGL